MMNLIVYSQNSIQNDDTVTITRKQQRTCIECLINTKIKDSIIIQKDSIIVTQGDFIIESNSKILELDSMLYKSKEETETQRKRKKRAYFIGGGIAVLVETIIFFLVK